MNVILLLMLASLAVATVFLGGFIWAVRAGQFSAGVEAQFPGQGVKGEPDMSRWRIHGACSGGGPQVDVEDTRARSGAGDEDGRAEGREARFRNLLPGEGQLQQPGFFKRAAKQFDGDRQSIVGEPGRKRNRRQPGGRAQLAIRSGLRFADQRGFAAQRRVGEDIEPMFLHGGEDGRSEGASAAGAPSVPATPSLCRASWTEASGGAGAFTSAAGSSAVGTVLDLRPVALW